MVKVNRDEQIGLGLCLDMNMGIELSTTYQSEYRSSALSHALRPRFPILPAVIRRKSWSSVIRALLTQRQNRQMIMILVQISITTEYLFSRCRRTRSSPI
jgi:hypothetical protein